MTHPQDHDKRASDLCGRLDEARRIWSPSPIADLCWDAQVEVARLEVRIAELEAGQSEWNAMLEMIEDGNREIATLRDRLGTYREANT